MSESIDDKFQRHCSLFLYAFSPQHIKDVCIAMVSTYESKIFQSDNERFSYVCLDLSTENYHD